jgi:hypothetical protein
MFANDPVWASAEPASKEHAKAPASNAIIFFCTLKF